MESVFVYGVMRPSLYPLRGMDSTRAWLEISGWQLMSMRRRYPILVANDQKGKSTTRRIMGEVIQVPTLTDLDSFEGYLPNETGLFTRSTMIIKVRMPTGTQLQQAWVYYMTRAMFDKIKQFGPTLEIPSGDWADELGG